MVGLAATLAAVAGGCFYNDAGLPPPAEGFYFPTGLVVSPGRSALYVANSDFDLQYNGGTVQVLDLATLRATLGKMLAGVRCSEGSTDACAPAGFTADTQLQDVCQAIPASHGFGNSGDACSQPSDCRSALCSSGTCAACSADTDCQGGGETQCAGMVLINPPHTCTAGVCMLACNNNQILTPSACTPLSPPFARSGTVGAFASGVALAKNPLGGARLFVPVRGDPSITWFDVPDDSSTAGQCAASGQPCGGAADCCTGFCDGTGKCGFQLACGQNSADQHRCDDAHRMGVDPYDNYRDLSLPVEPVGLAVSSDGQDIVTAHNIAGGPAVGLSQNPWSPQGTTPTFAYYATGNIPTGPTEVASVRSPKVVSAPACATDFRIRDAYQPGFLVTYNATAEVDLFRVYHDADSRPARPFLNRAGQASITVNANGSDSRGLVVDTSERDLCEQKYALDDLHDLAKCADTPLRVFIANRAPPSLLLGRVRTVVSDTLAPDSTSCVAVCEKCDDTTTTCCSGNCQDGMCVPPSVYDVAEIYGQIPLSGVAFTGGPSKVALGAAIQPSPVADAQATSRQYVFAVTFDTRFVFMYDPVAQRVVQVIRTGRGPHAIAFDGCVPGGGPGMKACGPHEAPYAYLYVGHFTDSYLGVVDLDMRHPETFGTMFASIGTPLPPLESK
jgi:hypothetical protein